MTLVIIEARSGTPHIAIASYTSDISFQNDVDNSSGLRTYIDIHTRRHIHIHIQIHIRIYVYTYVLLHSEDGRWINFMAPEDVIARVGSVGDLELPGPAVGST